MFITRRRSCPADAEFARAVHHRAYREVIERHYGPWNEKQQDDLFAAAWSEAEHEIIMCDDSPCGYLCLEDRGDDLYLRELVVDSGFQRKGIGTKLLQDIIDEAGRRNLRVALRTQTTNRAVNLYRRIGFQEIGHTDSHIMMEWRPF